MKNPYIVQTLCHEDPFHWDVHGWFETLPVARNACEAIRLYYDTNDMSYRIIDSTGTEHKTIEDEERYREQAERSIIKRYARAARKDSDSVGDEPSPDDERYYAND